MNSRLRAAWWATIVLFLAHGLVVATWISRIPAVKSALHLNNLVLGLTLLGSAVGALCAIPAAGWLVGRYGSKRISILASCLFCLTLCLPGLAVNGWSLALALYVFGASAAAMGVAMNAHAVEVEKQMQRATMSRFHAMFSLGAMIGAGVGGALAARSVAPLAQFAASGGINLIAVLWIGRFLLDTHDATRAREHRLPLRAIPPMLLALSAIGFFSFLAEGAIADWTALYLQQVLKADQGTAAVGYSVFSAAMAIARFLGDAVTSRLGPYRSVFGGSLLAAAGLTWALGMQSAIWAMPGFAIVGCGFSIIVPVVFGSAGRVPQVGAGAAIATVSGLGYLGFIAGPPTIGFLSQMVTLRYALIFVVACCCISAILSRQMRGLGKIVAVETDAVSVAGQL